MTIHGKVAFEHYSNGNHLEHLLMMCSIERLKAPG
jgi:hypothetical protein